MNYTKCHDAIIERAQNREITGAVEIHHIIPRCMYGTNDTNNLVKLTPREHYVVHQLLVKMYPNNDLLIYAVHLMSGDAHYRNNRSYSWARKKFTEQHSKRMKGKNTGPQTPAHVAKRAAALKGKPSKLKGRILSPDRIKKQSDARRGKGSTLKGRKQSPEHVAKKAAARRGKSSTLKGRTLSAETKKKISESCKGKRGPQVKLTCPYCDKTSGATVMKRWHFDNCKLVNPIC